MMHKSKNLNSYPLTTLQKSELIHLSSGGQVIVYLEYPKSLTLGKERDPNFAFWEKKKEKTIK